MPLVRIDVLEGRSDEELQRLLDTVQEVMESDFEAPPRDRYQVLTEHPPGRLVLQDSGLGIDRSDKVVLVQVFQQGRSEAQKKALYASLARRLHEEVGLRPEDLVVSVSENTIADWSFGFGVAQFLEADL
ncbi:MAG TPA: tautomerase family protein [Nocardioidaceae bacterium]|nr:tautomerase family protein [Nocardioidaceae bacterium]